MAENTPDDKSTDGTHQPDAAGSGSTGAGSESPEEGAAAMDAAEDAVEN
ncbi:MULTISPECIES: hypothetical protein [unclassified Microbacterium]